MKYENKKFFVREYDQFPHRKGSDEFVKEFDTLEEAEFESKYRNRKARFGERYYVQDLPHEEVVVTASMKMELNKKYGLK